MFGYIKPLTCQLRVYELEQWKAAYCGLCFALAKRYGHISRYLVNYDLAFLALILSGLNGGLDMTSRRCPYSPWKKRMVCGQSKAFEAAADICVILSWWRIRDNAADSRGPMSAVYASLSSALGGMRRRAASYLPDIDLAAQEQINTLRAIEQEKVAAIDPGAHAFATLLKASAMSAPPKDRRALEIMLYHVGRWIYIIDACDDLEQDIKEHNYNPVAARWDCRELSADTKDEIASTLESSAAIAASAFELLNFGACTGLIGNILYAGMPAVVKKILFENGAKR